ncbi:MAG: LytTR family DNA-binding domain-containing protein [Oscillospiraceae bacterium]|nr:LytTR family DNA-binding domain-containing protein [Oscillospiraceae bacterium]
MSRLTIALCDDDPAFRAVMEAETVKICRDRQMEAEVLPTGSAGELLTALGHISVQLIFLDIDMPDMDGVLLGKLLRQQGCTADIIYVSNMEERVYEVFQAHPWSFIRKARFAQELPGVMDAYIQSLRQRAGRVVLQNTEGVHRSFGPEDILYIEAAGKTQKLFLLAEPEPFLVRISLHELEQQLVPMGFIRIHKGFAVNYRYIQKITSRSVLLDTGQTLPIGRDRLTSARETYLALMKWRGLEQEE